MKTRNNYKRAAARAHLRTRPRDRKALGPFFWRPPHVKTHGSIVGK